MATETFMIIERFRGGDPGPVYRRLRDQGRLMPDGVTFVTSWIDANLERCFQVMQATDRRRLDEWIAAWSDLVEFEVVPVVTSAEARARVLGPASSDHR